MLPKTISAQTVNTTTGSMGFGSVLITQDPNNPNLGIFFGFDENTSGLYYVGSITDKLNGNYTLTVVAFIPPNTHLVSGITSPSVPTKEVFTVSLNSDEMTGAPFYLIGAGQNSSVQYTLSTTW